MQLDDLYSHAPQLRETFVERFWAKVDSSGDVNDCWPWTAYTTQAGYGHVSAQFDSDDSRDIRTHRVAYMLTHGEVVDEQLVCHSCDHRPCCNPRHLWQGSDADNAHDRDSKGRWRPADRRGERSGNNKLTQKQVATIRERYASGDATHRSLADEFGVTHSNIGCIIRGKSWMEA